LGKGKELLLQGMARRGQAWWGLARRGKAWHGMVF